MQSVGECVQSGDQEVEGQAPVAEDGEVGEGQVDGAGVVGDEVAGYYVDKDCEGVEGLRC